MMFRRAPWSRESPRGSYASFEDTVGTFTADSCDSRKPVFQSDMLARAHGQWRWFLCCLQPRLALVDLVVRVLPEFFAVGLRARLYRFAGCQIAPGVTVFGRLYLYGGVP